MTTIFDKNIQPEFQGVLDDDEEIIWSDKPVFIPYLLTNIWYNAFLLVFGVTVLFFLFYSPTFGLDKHDNPNYYLWITSSIFTLWGLWSIINALLSYGNTSYAYSAKRVMMRTGFIGTDFQTIDLDRIANLEVNVNIVERIYNVGTVKFSTGQTNSDGKLIYSKFISIKNPYQIFKLVKQISLDIKTDLKYPNALRPDSNPGYKTKYRRR